MATEELMAEIKSFQSNLEAPEAGVMDVEGVHRELSSGLHGQKIDFDTIPRFSPLYNQWISVAGAFIKQTFPEIINYPRDRHLSGMILGVANGTNRVARDLATGLNPRIIRGEPTLKVPGTKEIQLHRTANEVIKVYRPKLVVVIEDVGTTGGNAAQAALAAREAGAERVEVVNTWQRQEELPRLDEAGVEHHAIINQPLPTYTPEDCQAEGFCVNDWQLIPRK